MNFIFIATWSQTLRNVRVAANIFRTWLEHVLHPLNLSHPHFHGKLPGQDNRQFDRNAYILQPEYVFFLGERCILVLCGTDLCYQWEDVLSSQTYFLLQGYEYVQFMLTIACINHTSIDKDLTSNQPLVCLANVNINIETLMNIIPDSPIFWDAQNAASICCPLLTIPIPIYISIYIPIYIYLYIYIQHM